MGIDSFLCSSISPTFIRCFCQQRLLHIFAMYVFIIQVNGNTDATQRAQYGLMATEGNVCKSGCRDICLAVI